MSSFVAETLDWRSSPLGNMHAEQQAKYIEPMLANLFGYHVVQVYGSQNFLSFARIKHKVMVDAASTSFADASLRAHAYALPIKTDSVDVVVLSHTLEISGHPHHVLREVERMLIPEGHVIVMGFNPWSLVGVRRFVSWRSQKFPWCCKFYSLSRVMDWLALLGFEVKQVQRYFFVAPIQRGAVVAQKTWIDPIGARLWPYFSGAYMLLAKKRVSTLTPIRPRWGARLVSNEVTEIPMRRER